MDLDKINFWKRLEMFIENVQVNDAMSEEEKDMILRVAKEQMNQCPKKGEANTCAGCGTQNAFTGVWIEGAERCYYCGEGRA